MGWILHSLIEALYQSFLLEFLSLVMGATPIYQSLPRGDRPSLHLVHLKCVPTIPSPNLELL